MKLFLEDGASGYGEALPREYVTDETAESVFGKLCGVLPRRAMKVRFSSFRKGIDFLDSFKELEGSARSAFELALLDGLGKYFGKSFSDIVGPPAKNFLFASGAISAGSVPAVAKDALALKAFGFKSVKVKVGSGNDLNILNVVRKILGPKADIRVDANCAWGAEEAVKRIEEMRRFGVRVIEQPVRPYDLRGLKKVTESVSETIVADESLSSVNDAQKLARMKACGMFNIRISKCGGVLNALKIVSIARRNSIRYQLGCQVGESGLLSAAGRHFAFGVEGIEYFEGSYGKFLLKEDITKEDMTIGFGGKVRPVSGPGLGVTVIDRILEKYTGKKTVVS